MTRDAVLGFADGIVAGIIFCLLTFTFGWNVFPAFLSCMAVAVLFDTLFSHFYESY